MQVTLVLSFGFADPEAHLCMARVIASEARGEPLIAQVALGYVLYERAAQDPSQVCDEATQFVYDHPASQEHFYVLTNPEPYHEPIHD